MNFDDHDTGESVADLSVAIGRLRGDRQLLCELIEFFEDDAPLLLATAHDRFVAKDFAALERSVHSLKGLAATFEAESAVASARAIEEAAREQQSEALPALLVTLTEKFEQLGSFLSRYRQNQCFESP